MLYNKLYISISCFQFKEKINKFLNLTVGSMSFNHIRLIIELIKSSNINVN